MKTKRIVALALTAAMAVSMASMTAFAAGTWKDYEQTDIDSGDDTKAAYAYAFKEGTTGTTKYYVFETGADKSTTTTDGKTVSTYSFTTTQTGTEEAELKFGDIKSKLSTHANDADSDVKFVGWTYASADDHPSGSPLAADAALPESLLKDDKDIIGDLGGDAYGTAAKPLVLYEVWQMKTQADKDADAVERSQRPKVAKLTDKGSDWAFTQQQIEAKTSGAKGEEAGAKDSVEKCNTTMDKARVYDVKPYTKAGIGENAGKVVTLKSGTKVDVKLPLAPLVSGKKVKEVNKMIKDGELKVFHIGSDGKSHPVSGVSAVGDKDDDTCTEITFKYGTFSDFVITTDKDAKAQAGEEEGASAGNPATGEASALPVAMLALAALSATGVVAYKKRKAE